MARGISAERIEYQDGAFVSTDLALNRKRGPLTHIERQHLKYRLLTGAKRIMMKGVRIPADETGPEFAACPSKKPY
jgi:hypothetical protein